ncbi:MAG: hypothetical protein Q9208_007530 [Pyrenodesmia sp. 3 TL-2023]
MNHLPWPPNDEAPPLEIPYICDNLEDFDGLNFLEYPIRRGWSTPDDKFQWMTTSDLMVAKRVENWLFFGLLQVFLGDLFEKDDYITLSRRSHTSILDTTKLPLRLSSLVRCVGNGDVRRNDVLLSREDLREMWDSAFLGAKLHNGVLNSLMDKKRVTSVETLDALETLRTVAAPVPILLQSLRRAVSQIFLFDEELPAMCLTDHGPAKLSVWRMLDTHQCQAQVKNFLSQYSPFVNHYLSGLPRKYLKADHHNCSWDRCVGNTVDEASYQPRHVKQSCRCQFAGPDTGLVCQLIRGNRIPLVVLRIVAGEPKLKLVPAELDTKYVTLSHVWAGGLGNFHRNEVPTCELLRLHGLLLDLDSFRPLEPGIMTFQFEQLDWFQTILAILSRVNDFQKTITSYIKNWAAQTLQGDDERSVSEASPPVYFWMDTLCIPVDPQHRELRIKAIGAMALVYAAAERCLVLDPELQHISMKGLDPVQVNAHVFCSTWLTRSWTYQEARLSRAWYVQFADGLYNPNSSANQALHHRLYGHWHVFRSDAHSLACEMISWYHDMPAVRKPDIIANQSTPILNDSTYAFITTWNHLASRSTSKMEDVHGILANTLDRSAEEVLRLPVEERMKAILRSHERLPAALIFNDAPKVKDLGSRWVPLHPERTRLSEGYGVLHPSKIGFFLDKVEGDFAGFLVDPSVPRYEKVQLIDPSLSGPLWITICQESDGPPRDQRAAGDVLAVCYVMGHLKKSSQDRKFDHRPAGARFALRRREGNTLHLVYEYTFLYSYDYPKILLKGKEDFNPVYAQSTGPEAEFHIDCGKLGLIPQPSAHRYSNSPPLCCHADLSSWPTLTYRRDTTSEKSAHGLTFYFLFWAGCVASVWSPFYYLAGVSSHPHRLLLPTIIFLIRALVGLSELKKLQKRVNEHAYKAWVRTFDESGCLRKRDLGGQDQQGFEIGTRVKVSMGASMGVWFLAIVVDGWEYLRWFGVALFVEVIVRWVVEWMWWNTRVKRWVKGYVKGRNWW